MKYPISFQLPKLQAFGDGKFRRCLLTSWIDYFRDLLLDFGLEDELLFGSLNVTIHKLQGLTESGGQCAIALESLVFMM
jgi:hypothetical protein